MGRTVTTVRELVARDPACWRDATRHPFLDGVRSGSLPAHAFNRWLEQDRMFVETLVRAWSAMRTTAPSEDVALIGDGIDAFRAELVWFDDIAAEREVGAVVEPLPAAAAYQAHLLEVVAAPYPAAIAAMWAVEAAYLEAWETAAPGAPGYDAFVEHWTGAEFAAFVARLESAADRALAGAPVADVEAAAEAVLETARHEAAFWAMTWATS